MQRLSFIVIYLLIFQVVPGQSPHGDNFTLDCNDCHTSKSWGELRENLNFDHGSTRFELTGQHNQIGCKSCHDTLIFSAAPVNCNECHLDMHSNTLGQDCERCHTSESWIVTNINEIHDMSRFPLSGAHQTASCMECHETFDQFRFEVNGIECIDCHRQDYLSTQSPNHQENGYSLNCEECHGMSFIGWTGSDFNHHFFPLTGGHAISCTACHTSGSFEKLSTECFSCHQQDFEGADNPNHISLGFSQDCNLCHTNQPGWEPAKYADHDAISFPIYSGEHRGEWNSCSECHTQPNDYSFFTCLECHEHNQNDMDDEHRGVVGYSYNSTSCYACHPTGSEGSSFNHNETAFPLTGEHTTVDCASCHTDGYAGTPTECNACHNDDFMSAQEPNHVNAGIHLQCQDCHTSSGWSPSQFNHATTGFELSGGHAEINQCSECHKGSVENTSSECISCHQEDYNSAEGHVANGYTTNCLQCHTTGSWENADFDHNTTAFPLTGGHTTVDCASCHTDGYAGTPTECNACHNDDYNNAADPNHQAAGFPVECESCHSQSSWEPATFNHDGQYFPIYSGEHRGEWNSCSDCHTQTNNFALFSCIDCHAHNQSEMNSEHDDVSGYAYNSASCFSCHPNGKED